MVMQMKILLHETRLLLTGLLLACLFMPALLWLLNLKHGIHLPGLDSLAVNSFYRDFYTGLDDPLVWPLLLAPYLLHSLIRLLFHSSAPQAQETAPLEQAALKGHTETIKCLIAQGRDINARNIRGYSPLHLVVAKGNTEVVQLLLENGAEVDAVATDSGCTPLHYAASLGHAELCELLVRYGADPDAQTTRLETPLHLAVASGHAAVVALLLKYHARLDIRNKNGMTPLQQAETVNKLEIVSLIKQHLNEIWPYLIISRGRSAASR
jgi:ankyrin repeat protein